MLRNPFWAGCLKPTWTQGMNCFRMARGSKLLPVISNTHELVDLNIVRDLLATPSLKNSIDIASLEAAVWYFQPDNPSLPKVYHDLRVEIDSVKISPCSSSRFFPHVLYDTTRGTCRQPGTKNSSRWYTYDSTEVAYHEGADAHFIEDHWYMDSRYVWKYDPRMFYHRGNRKLQVCKTHECRRPKAYWIKAPLNL